MAGYSKMIRALLLWPASCAAPAPRRARRPAGPRARPPKPTVSLRMTGHPGEARVIVDDEAVGTLDFVAAHGVALPPGVHHVTVKAPGYFPWDKEVEAKLGAPPDPLEVALVPCLIEA